MRGRRYMRHLKFNKLISRRCFMGGVAALGAATIFGAEKKHYQHSIGDGQLSPLFTLIKDNSVVRTDRAETIVPWWSFTKTVIAAAALVLVRDEKLALDASLPGKPYTLRQLLQHRSGLPDYGGLPEYHEAVAGGEEPWSRAVFLKKANADKLLFEPGHGWQYSNLGYGLIADLIEQTTKQNLNDSLQSLVLNPLAVMKTRIALESADLKSVFMGDEKDYHPGWVFHGLLVGPLQESALFLHRLMTGTLLTPSLLDEIRKTHVLDDVPIGERPWVKPGYALGLMRGPVTGGLILEGHSGEGPGSVIAVYIAPEEMGHPTAAVFYSKMDITLVENFAVTMLINGNKDD